MNKDIVLIFMVLGSLGAKVYHMLSTSNCTIRRNRLLVDKQQSVISFIELSTPVILILYIISNICDSVRFVVPRKRDLTIRLLSLSWSLDGHNPYSAQVLHLSPMRRLHA